MKLIDDKTLENLLISKARLEGLVIAKPKNKVQARCIEKAKGLLKLVNEILESLKVMEDELERCERSNKDN